MVGGTGNAIEATPGTVPCLTSVALLSNEADQRGLPLGLVRAEVMHAAPSQTLTLSNHSVRDGRHVAKTLDWATYTW